LLERVGGYDGIFLAERGGRKKQQNRGKGYEAF
jgi:hypothetical protein